MKLYISSAANIRSEPLRPSSNWQSGGNTSSTWCPCLSLSSIRCIGGADSSYFIRGRALHNFIVRLQTYATTPVVNQAILIHHFICIPIKWIMKGIPCVTTLLLFEPMCKCLHCVDECLKPEPVCGVHFVTSAPTQSHCVAPSCWIHSECTVLHQRRCAGRWTWWWGHCCRL